MLHETTNFFTERTLQNLQLSHVEQKRPIFRAIDTILACKLTLTYSKYHQMMDLRKLAISDNTYSYEDAEKMADMLNIIFPWHHTTPSDLIHTPEKYADDAITAYKEYHGYSELFKDSFFIPNVVEMFCHIIYKTGGYYTFKTYSSLQYSIYTEFLLLYQLELIDYTTLQAHFQDVNFYNGQKKPLSLFKIKQFIKTMNQIVDIYKQIFCKFVSTSV